MKRRNCMAASRADQVGSAVVEFGLIAIVFLMLLIGVIEMGRVLFTWNAAVEATRYGARVAVVCDMNNTEAILTRMQRILPNMNAGNLSVAYLPSGCSAASCQQVRVSLSGLNVQTYIPIVGAILPVPPFSTTLPRESLRNAIDGQANPVCQ
jgi:Flp pilus assembly protein TadG